MATPTVPQLRRMDPSVLGTQAKEWRDKAGTIGDVGDAIARGVDSSHDWWHGPAGSAMRDRHDVVHGDARKVKDALDTAAAAADDGQWAIGSARDVALRRVDEATDAHFEVADDGTVTVPAGLKASVSDSSRSGSHTGDTDSAAGVVAAAALDEYAAQQTAAIKEALTTVGTVDAEVRRAIDRAFLDLPVAQGPSSGRFPAQLGGDAGAADGWAVATGHLPIADLLAIADRLRTAGLTEQQVADIAHGRPAQLSDDQWDYLREFYAAAGKDGVLSMTERLTEQGEQTKAASVVDGLTNLANPAVHSASGATGGFAQLPPDLQKVLAAPAVQFDRMTPNGMVYSVPDADDLARVSRMVGLADQGSAQGSDVRKALLEKAADLAGFDPRYGSLDLPPDEVDRLATDTLRAGAADHVAVHDVLAGAYNGHGEQIYDALLHHEWGDKGAALGDLVRWTGTDATSPDVATATRAGETASSLARYLSGHSDTMLNLHGPRSESIGAVNPFAVQGFGAALAPYQASMIGVQPEVTGTHGFPMLDRFGDFSHGATPKLFSVIDTDQTAAGEFNAKALDMSGKLEAAWVHSALQDPQREDWGFAEQAGAMQGLVEHGLDLEATDRTQDDRLETSHGFADRGAAYDAIKVLLKDGVKNIPFVGQWASTGIDALAPELKTSMLGVPPVDYTTTPHGDYSSRFGEPAQYYQIAQVLQDHSGGTLPPGLAEPGLLDRDTGQLKPYDKIIGSQPVGQADSGLINLVHNYDGGVLRPNIDTFIATFEGGRSKVLGR